MKKVGGWRVESGGWMEGWRVEGWMGGEVEVGGGAKGRRGGGVKGWRGRWTVEGGGVEGWMAWWGGVMEDEGWRMDGEGW